MAIFYSAKAHGFFNTKTHGEREISIADPAWTRPTHEVVLAPHESLTINGVTYDNPNDFERTVSGLPDYSIPAPMILVTNPACTIPGDAVEITHSEHMALLTGQTSSIMVVPDAKGRPVLGDRPAPSLEDARARVIASIDRRYAAEVEAAAGGRSAAEMATFERQEREARAYRASKPKDESVAPMLVAIAKARGTTLAKLVSTVIEKADLYAVAMGEALGKAQAQKAAVMAAETAEALTAATPA